MGSFRYWGSVLVLAWSCSQCWAQAAAGPAKDVPELAALSHYVGVWDSTMTTKLADGKEIKREGVANAEWIHDGRFVRQTWTSNEVGGANKLSGSSMYTFDTAKNTYRTWEFVSVGYTADGEGSWNSKTKTMMWTMHETDPNYVTVIKAHFVDDNTEQWTITTKDGMGRVLSESSGKNVRRKK